MRQSYYLIFSHFEFSFRIGRTCDKEIYFRICRSFLYREMSISVPIVQVPVPAYQCCLVVFPAPSSDYEDNSKFYVLQKHRDVFQDQIGYTEIEYIPSMVYCFLPSCEKRRGKVSVYASKPNFIDSYNFCFEVSIKSLIFSHCRLQKNPINHVRGKIPGINMSNRCGGCFSNHFPRRNTLNCKWRKGRKTSMGEGVSKNFFQNLQITIEGCG